MNMLPHHHYQQPLNFEQGDTTMTASCFYVSGDNDNVVDQQQQQRHDALTTTTSYTTDYNINNNNNNSESNNNNNNWVTMQTPTSLVERGASVSGITTSYHRSSSSSSPVSPHVIDDAVLTEKEMDQFPSVQEFDMIVDGYLSNLSNKKRDKALVDRPRYALIARVLKDPKNTAISTAQFRFWVKKMFQLMPCSDGSELICHDNKPVAMREDMYDILVHAHAVANHGGRDKTSSLVRRRYSWIPKELIARFVRQCPFCIARRNGCPSPPITLLPTAPPDYTADFCARDDDTTSTTVAAATNNMPYPSQPPLDIKPLFTESDGFDIGEWTPSNDHHQYQQKDEGDPPSCYQQQHYPATGFTPSSPITIDDTASPTSSNATELITTSDKSSNNTSPCVIFSTAAAGGPFNTSSESNDHGDGERGDSSTTYRYPSEMLPPPCDLSPASHHECQYDQQAAVDPYPDNNNTESMCCYNNASSPDTNAEEAAAAAAALSSAAPQNSVHIVDHPCYGASLDLFSNSQYNNMYFAYTATTTTTAEPKITIPTTTTTYDMNNVPYAASTAAYDINLSPSPSSSFSSSSSSCSVPASPAATALYMPQQHQSTLIFPEHY